MSGPLTGFLGNTFFVELMKRTEPTEEDSYWNLPLARRRLILDLVELHRIPLGLAGHWHRNAVARHGDFEMVTTGAVGYPLGADPPGFTVVTVDRGRFSHAYVPLQEVP